MILPHMNNAFSQKYVCRLDLLIHSKFIRNDRIAYNSIEYASKHENCIIFLRIDAVYS